MFRVRPSGSSAPPPDGVPGLTGAQLRAPKTTRKSLHLNTLDQESQTEPLPPLPVIARPLPLPIRHLALWLGLLSLAATISCGSGSLPEARGPNVLLITIDTLRADHLSAYGYPRPTSPNIDALAERGLVFERALSTSGSTLPAHLSIMTGMLPHQHGFLSNMRAMKGSFEPAPGCETAATFFERAGWDSVAFISGNTVKKVTGIDAGFGLFEQPSTRNRTAEKTLSQARSWLQERQESGSDKPFFLWVHFWDVHEPNDPPEPHRSMFRAGEATERVIAERRVEAAKLQKRFSERQIARMFYPDLARRFERGEQVEVPAIDHSMVMHLYDMYDASIHFVDAQVGSLLDALETLGLQEHTLIALAADHGQALGQHDWLEHGSIQSEVVHVPLILYLPGTGIEQPRRIDRVVSIVDLMPTLVSRLQHPTFDAFLEQASGSDLFAGGEARGWAFSHRTTRPRNWEPGRMVAIGTEKWRYYDLEQGEDKLFDLEQDPGELVNVIDEHGDAARSFARLVQDVLSTRPEVAGISRELSEEEREELEHDLRETGYLGDDEEDQD